MCMCCGNTDPQKFKTVTLKNIEVEVCEAEPKCCNKNQFNNIEEIDEMIADSIRVLIQNGYKTLHCCQGHYLGTGGIFRGPGGYISFEVNQNDENDFKKYQALIDCIPDKIDEFNMNYFIFHGPKGPYKHERNILVEKLVIRFKLPKGTEVLTQLDFLEQNLALHKKLLCHILNIIEEQTGL